MKAKIATFATALKERERAREQLWWPFKRTIYDNEELLAFRLSYFNVNVAQLMCAVSRFFMVLCTNVNITIGFYYIWGHQIICLHHFYVGPHEI